MRRTELYAVLAVLACVAFYLNGKTRLTHEEKKKVFTWAMLALPIVGFGTAIVLFGVHGDLYNVTSPITGIRDQDGPLSLLSALAGVAASLGVLAYADRVQRDRTEAHFAQLAQAELAQIEQAKRDAAGAAQRLLDTQLKIDQTRQQTLLTAVAVNQRQFAAQEAEQVLFDAFDKFCQRANVYQYKTKDELRDAFRLELARRAIPKLDLRKLESSPNPEVQRLLRRPTLKLTPTDDERAS